MHVIQYVAVQADSVEEAHEDVRRYLGSQMGDSYAPATWYDWFVAGGGRWATGEENQYNDNWTGDVVHQSDPKFQEYLETAKKYRLQELNQYRSEVGDLDLAGVMTSLDTVDISTSDYAVSQKLYALKRIYEMTIGQWDYDSYFFDVIHDSANMMWLQESLDKGATNWYIVPVDFHF